MTDDVTYELRVAGHLDDHWASWLDDVAISRRADGTSALTGAMADQAQLHGVLARLRDIGAPLLSLRLLDAPMPPTPRDRRDRGPGAATCSGATGVH